MEDKWKNVICQWDHSRTEVLQDTVKVEKGVQRSRKDPKDEFNDEFHVAGHLKSVTRKNKLK